MMQGTLFDLGTPPAAAAPVWERIGGVDGGTCAAWHLHVASGVHVIHCGHPTANFPYYIVMPDGSKKFAPNGRGWQHLKDAKALVESLWETVNDGS